MPDQVEVTQEDRQLYAAIMGLGAKFAEPVLRGDFDAEEPLQLLARHRQDAIQKARADALELERDLECEIANRDMAEEALFKAFLIVTGREPQWSNLFTFTEALAEMDETIAATVPLLEMLETATNEEGCTVFDHNAEEIGIAVMEAYPGILDALEEAAKRRRRGLNGSGPARPQTLSAPSPNGR